MCFQRHRAELARSEPDGDGRVGRHAHVEVAERGDDEVDTIGSSDDRGLDTGAVREGAPDAADGGRHDAQAGRIRAATDGGEGDQPHDRRRSQPLDRPMLCATSPCASVAQSLNR